MAILNIKIKEVIKIVKKFTAVVGTFSPIEVNYYTVKKFLQIDAPVVEVPNILLTHAHFDHIAGLDKVNFSNETLFITIHKQELPILKEYNLYSFFVEEFSLYEKAEYNLLNGEEGEFKIKVNSSSLAIYWLLTPGHTPGSVTYALTINGILHVFTGDFLFAESIGRCDLPMSNPEAMKSSLSRFSGWIKHLMKIHCISPQNTIIYPGHGARVRLSTLFKINPFLT